LQNFLYVQYIIEKNKNLNSTKKTTQYDILHDILHFSSKNLRKTKIKKIQWT